MRRTGPWVCALALLASLLIAAPAHAGGTVSIQDFEKEFFEGDDGTKIMKFTVVLSASQAGTVKVDFKTIETDVASAAFEDDAKAGQDFIAKNGTVTFQPGDRSQPVKVPIVGDRRNEKSYEYLGVKLSNPVRTNIGAAKALGLVYNDDPLPNFTYAGSSVTEGDPGDTKSIQVDVELTEASWRQVKLGWWLENDIDGQDPDAIDWTGGEGTLTWQPGQTLKTITIPVTEDETDEDDQLLTFGFGAQINAAMDIDHDHSATIEDDDAAPTVSIGAGSANEGDESNYSQMPLTWSHPTEKPVSGTWSLTHVTTDDFDFFTLGGGSFGYDSLQVGIGGDNTPESNETFTVTLDAAATNATVVEPKSATGTITNDD